MADGRTAGGRVWLTAALVAAAAPLSAEGRRAIPTFGVDVEVVSLSLAVTDPRGRHVGDVSDQDLAVFEDGVPQPLSLFTREEWPITVAILIDGSNSMQRSLPVVKAAARRLVHTLGPGDRAEIVRFSRRLTVLHGLTSDRAALEAAVDAVDVDGDTALYNALYVTLKDLAASKRESEMARRALVILTDGNDTASMVDDEQVLDLARQAEVSVYAIGFRESPPGGRTSEEPLPRYFLTALARETGGRAFFPATLSDLEGVYEEIAEELRTLYGLAYVSSNPQRDGHWRKITVRTRRPNLLVRHRAGYYAPSTSRLADRR
jgi:Ca-activated chloride channel family protein